MKLTKNQSMKFAGMAIMLYDENGHIYQALLTAEQKFEVYKLIEKTSKDGKPKIVDIPMPFNITIDVRGMKGRDAVLLGEVNDAGK